MRSNDIVQFLNDLAEVAKKHNMSLVWDEFSGQFWVLEDSEEFTNELLEAIDGREKYAEMKREREEREANRRQHIREQQKGFEDLLPEEPKRGL